MNLLTANEVAKIEANANKMQILRQEHCMNIGITPTDILNLSAVHGLILIKGHQETGFDHIHIRHEFYSSETYWKEEGATSLAYPSKFSPKSIPIIDYVRIADALYEKEFYNIEKNKNPDLFDLYEGMPSINLDENRRYRMLLYKGSKVIHTLYPTNEKYTKKKPTGFLFHRGGVKVEENLMSGMVTVSIPYLNREKTKSYTAIMIYKPAEGKRYLKIKIHRKDKADLVCDNYDPEPFNGVLPDSGFLNIQFQHVELVELEKLIVDIENDRNVWSVMP